MPRRKRRKAKVWVLKMDGVQPVPRPSTDDVALDLVLGAHEIVGTAPPHALIPVSEDRSFRADMTVAWQAHVLDVDVGHWAHVKKQEVFSMLKLPRRSELIRKELVDLGIQAMAELAWALEEGERKADCPDQERLRAMLYELVSTYRSIACLFALHQFRDGFALCQLFVDQLEALTETEGISSVRPPDTECEASEQGPEREPSEPSCIGVEQAPPKAPGQGARQEPAEPYGQEAERETYEPSNREVKNESSGSSAQRPRLELDPQLAGLHRFLDSCDGQVSATPFPFSKDTRPEVDGRTLRGRRRKQREQGASTKDKAKGSARRAAEIADKAARTSTSTRTKAISADDGSSTRGARSNDRDSDTGSTRGNARDSDAASTPPTASAEPTQGPGTEAQANPRETATTTTYLDKPLEALVCSALLPYLALLWCRCFERIHHESLETRQWWELAADGTLTATAPASFSSGYAALREAVAAEADRVMQASGTGLPYPDPLYAMPLFPKSPTKPAHLADAISVSARAQSLAELLDLQITWPTG